MIAINKDLNSQIAQLTREINIQTIKKSLKDTTLKLKKNAFVISGIQSKK